MPFQKGFWSIYATGPRRGGQRWTQGPPVAYFYIGYGSKNDLYHFGRFIFLELFCKHSARDVYLRYLCRSWLSSEFVSFFPSPSLPPPPAPITSFPSPPSVLPTPAFYLGAWRRAWNSRLMGTNGVDSWDVISQSSNPWIQMFESSWLRRVNVILKIV